MSNDFIADALSRLLGEPTQHQRLLRLTTPLGAHTLLAERLDGAEAVGPCDHAGLRFTVHALSTSVHLDARRLIGQPALLQLELADASLRSWHAHITAVALVGSDGGLARWRLALEPWLAFLGHRVDSYVFQGKSVPQVLDEVFADYQGQGKLAPAWRFELADASVYPERSLCIQYQESDLAFVQRLMLEEGLFGWFEHEGAPDAANLGRHTLVIADHNAALKPNAQPRVRYTQSSASHDEDSLVRWQRSSRVQATSLALTSPDYRCGAIPSSLRPAYAQTVLGAPVALGITDTPGAYAYEDGAQGERMARCQMEALDAQRQQVQGRGSWRQAQPGTVFTLSDHPVHDGRDPERDRFAILGVQHRARNNLSADLKAGIDSLLGAIRSERKADRVEANDEPLYEARLTAQRASVPVRMAAVGSGDEAGLPDPRIHLRPRVHGVQTALVVGTGGPVHTDRDHRIKVQFHWQRGANGSHRRTHPSDANNAPANDASGTWVRVAEQAAGANWGSAFTPRVGQEVLVGFVGGDVDRPVVIGSVYNGRGSDNAAGNQVNSGAAGATGNAAAWFPGSLAEGKFEGHQHPAALSGYKSQELNASAHGAGGYNQLVFDDSAGQGRIELSSLSEATRLQLGHLLNMQDNRRLQPRGHGLDLSTQAWGALRAGSGLLISAHGKPSSAASTANAAQQMDSQEPRGQLAQSRELAKGLAETAQQHDAKLDGEAKLAVEEALKKSIESLGATAGSAGTEGGLGSTATFGRPDLVIAAPAGIAAYTPASMIASAGNTASLIAQDVSLLAQGKATTAVKSGLVFFTYGKQGPGPVKQTGIQLHAATGSVNTQSQTAATRLTADKAVHVASTQGMVLVAALKHIQLAAGGAAIRLGDGGISLTAPGKVLYKASMKELGPGRSAQTPGIAFTSMAMRMPVQPLAVSLIDADELSPSSEPVTLVDARGTEHAVTVAGGATTVADFKPGFAYGRQTRRTED